MLPKKYKLDSKEVELVMTKGKMVSSDLFLLKFIKISPEKADYPIRISVITPKKVFNTAVLRNSTRRKVYAALRQNIELAINAAHSQNQTTDQILICLVCSPKVKNQNQPALQYAIKQVFQKSAIIAQ